jgi:Fic family protein
MINSQIPFNKLPEIEFHLNRENSEFQKVYFEAYRSLDFLNGFLEGYNDELLEFYLNNLVLADLKYSMELESFPISMLRVFEASASENALHDDLLHSLIDYYNKVKWVKVVSLENLKPNSFKPTLKNIDAYRERKECLIKSYFTNLTLYTAPNQGGTVVNLRQNLEQFLLNFSHKDMLEYGVVGHYQIRAVSPFHALNGLVARSFLSMSLKDVANNILYLPVAHSILENKETYQTLMRDIMDDDSLSHWIQFNVDVLVQSCYKMVYQLKSFSKLKRTLYEQTQKYPAYNLPVELADLLMCKPFVKTQDIIDVLNCHRHSAYTYLKHLVKMGVLVEKSSGREKMYLNRALLDIIAG